MRIKLFTKKMAYILFMFILMMFIDITVSKFLDNNLIHVLLFMAFNSFMFYFIFESSKIMSDERIVFDFRSEFQKLEKENQEKHELKKRIVTEMTSRILEGEISKDLAQNRTAEAIEYIENINDLLNIDSQQDLIGYER